MNATRERTGHRHATMLALLLLAASATAEETTADWLKKILDPATIDVAPFPGSTLNRKLSVDTIRYDRDAPASRRTAVYTAPLDQLDAAGKHFERVLATKPVVDTDPKGNKRYTFALAGPGSYPPKAKGLKVTIVKSPWVDNMVQIDMVWQPPG
jgi:hypothetical protein